jgi:hypothetical protein
MVYEQKLQLLMTQAIRYTEGRHFPDLAVDIIVPLWAQLEVIGAVAPTNMLSLELVSTTTTGSGPLFRRHP